MPNPLEERMDALTAANVRLLKRVEALERRVAELSGEPPAEQALAPLVPPVPQPAAEMTPLSAQEPAPEPASPPAPPAVPQDEGLETSLGLKWVNRLGAVTLMIGALFFFKYAADSGWLGPLARVLLGLVAGSGLAGYGFLNWRANRAVFAQGITAAGTVILYLSFWAAYSLYHLIPAALAFGLMAGATVLTGAFAWLYGSQAMAALGYVGGGLTPILLSSGEYRPWFFTCFLAGLNVAWMWIARREGWRRLELLAASFTVFLSFGFLESLRGDDRQTVGSVWVVANYFVFVLSPIAWLMNTAQWAAGAVAGGIWNRQPAQGIWLSVGLLAVGMGLAQARQTRWLPHAGIAGFSLAYVLLRLNMATSDPRWALFAGATLAFVLVLLYITARTRKEAAPDVAELALLVSPGALYFFAGYEFLSGELLFWRGLFTALIALVYLGLAGRFRPSGAGEGEGEWRPMLFCAGMALAFATTAVAVQFSGFRITMIWALEAAALAWLAAHFAQPRLRWAVAALTVITLGRLVGWDASIYPYGAAIPLLFNLRMGTFLTAALGLGLAAWWQRPSPWALLPYLSAHFGLLMGLSLEVRSWAVQYTAAVDHRSATLVGLSVLGAVYALALVASGVLLRFRLNRLMGLALFGLVVLKLYLADVWVIGRLYRIVAFSALGALLLATSFFYARFRTKLEAWISHDAPSRD
jgi:uncharacterized membrane protein